MDGSRDAMYRRMMGRNRSDVIVELSERWFLTLGDPFPEESGGSRVAPATRNDGSLAVLKIGMPQMEARDETAALLLLDGDPTIRVFEYDESVNAMLLERCLPGTALREEFQPDQDVVIASLLKRFWREAPEEAAFRPLSMMIRHWTSETLARENDWYDVELVRRGLDMFEELCDTSIANTLLATDLHAGNVLAAEREPWLVIDPKPFVGDRAYDATQHLLNCRTRLRDDPVNTIHRVAELLDVDPHRVARWLFARLAAEPRSDWDDEPTGLAVAIGKRMGL